MIDYLENSAVDQEEKTRRIFKNFDEFKNKIKEMFGNVDEERTAAQQIYMLK
jgi:cell fate (sporulation/competence/biofilm development) regulator YlbF (YheA/YmcA/DUF963 family)